MSQGKTVIDQVAKEKISSTLAMLESFLDGQQWLSADENVSIADLSILAAFSILVHLGQDITAYPNLSAWYERCSSLPGFAENEKGAKMLAGFIKSKMTEPF